MEDWVTIRNLKSKNPSLSNREIGRLLNLSHNTVRKALLNDVGPKYVRKKYDKEIDKFKSIIDEMIFVKKLHKCRIFNELVSKGYKGSKSSFYRYCATIEDVNKRTFKPYETEPGEQSQYDWSEYKVPIANKLTKVYVFSYILSFSRYRVYEPSLSQSQSSIFAAIENALIETGGVTERIQTDNAKSFVIDASRNNFQWNKNYLNFCGYYAIKPTRSLPSRPWSKGKVENPFKYLETHFIDGNSFESFEDFCIKLKKFQDEVNDRVHLTTKMKPNDLFYKELSSLGKLPEYTFSNIKDIVRKVTSDCLISFQSNRYSVPYLFAHREVWIKVSRGHSIEIYSQQNKLIAAHKIVAGKGNVVIKDEHYKNHSSQQGNWKRLMQTFANIFPDYNWFIEKLQSQKRINRNYHLTQILGLLKFYKTDDLIKAFTICNQYNTFNFQLINSYLQNNCEVEKLEATPINNYLKQKQQNPNIVRPLSEYNLFIDN